MNNMPILAKMLVPYRKTKSQLIQHINFIFLELNNMTILAKMLVPYGKTKSQQIHHFNMVHPRDISLTESWGSSRFFIT